MKQRLIKILLLLMCFPGIHSPAYAQLQLVIEAQSQDNEYTNENDLYLLAKLITIEAKGEPFEGQVAVGAVVLNRVQSSKFPDSIRKVLYQPGQFSTIRQLNRTIPKDSSIRAAKKAFHGNDPSHGALYFYNPVTCSPKARRYIKSSNFRVTARIGRHVFYK